MQTNSDFSVRYPTHQEIQRGIARGRRERAVAISAMARALFGFVLGRRVRTLSRGRVVAYRPC